LVAITVKDLRFEA